MIFRIFDFLLWSYFWFGPGYASSSFQIVTAEELSNSTQGLSQVCMSALDANLQCDSFLIDIVSSDDFFALPNSDYNTFCTPACSSSLAAYQKNVTNACGNAQPYPGLPATFMGDVYWQNFNLTCLTNPTTGAYCMPYFENLTTYYTNDMSVTNYPNSILCSPCMTALFRLQQSTSFSNYGTQMALDWASIQKTCGSSYPTAIPARNYTITLPGFAPTGYPIPTGCYSNSTYKVASGDTCTSISNSRKVSTSGIIALNNLLPDCRDLQAGATLCLPPACSVYNVVANDTCASIINNQNITISQFLSWNPSINNYCTNLITDQNVCVGQPGPTYTGTTVSGATVTQTGVYASSTVPVPSNIAHGTTTSCGAYYTVQSGDYCALIAINNTITVGLFEDINPSINSNCSNLTPGLAYCVWPTSNWNSTSTSSTTSTYVTAPAPTPSGTTSDCYLWHKVVSTDNCGLLEAQYSITFEQLQFWNPSLDAACSNLILGDAYCVSGGISSGASTTTAAKKASSAHKTATAKGPSRSKGSF